jgi:NAD(P)-dependent dehydrogenase (short-subunit alcohol dehydrogenase family)
MPTALITGASRGIGLEHARQYARRGWRVLATARSVTQASPLVDLAAAFPGSVVIQPLDVTAQESVARLAAAWSDETIDVVVNNAGTYGPSGAPEGMRYQSLGCMDYAIWRQILDVNLLAPFRVAVAFRPHLLRGEGRRLVMMSSDLGSIAQNASGGSHAYRSSKAALNMITRGMAVEWPELIVIAMAPGWTRTELGGPDAPLSAEDSVHLQQQVIDRLGPAHSGSFLNRFGEIVPW